MSHKVRFALQPGGHSTMKLRLVCCAAVLDAILFFGVPASASPIISNASGTFSHQSTVTITGSGFGTKIAAPPVIWDDASTGTYPTDNGKWDGYYPHYPDESTIYHLRYT